MQMIIIILFLTFIVIKADIYDEVKNSRNFTGKVILVTGSSSGIGEATVKLFASLGARVVITGRNATNIKRVAEEARKLSPYGLVPLEVVADLTIDEDVVKLVNETIKQFSKIDVLVNNAGSGVLSHIKDDSILKEFDDVFRIDLRAPLYLIHLSIPYLENSKGTIINISSIGAFIPASTSLTYGMAKASVNMMTQVLAVELGSSGIRVNTISPGYIRTSIASVVDDQYVKRFEEIEINATSVKRAGEPIDVAKGIAFLASTDAHFITGSNLLIDGGALYNHPANAWEHLFD